MCKDINAEDLMDEAHDCLNTLDGILNTEKISKKTGKNIKDQFMGLLKLVTKQNLRIAYLEGQLESTQNIEDYIQGVVSNKTSESYADKVKARIKGQPERQRSRSRSRKRKEHKLLVFPKDESLTSQEVKDHLVKNINPNNLKIGVKSVKNVRKGGVIIETVKEDDIKILEDAIKENQKLKEIVEPQRPVAFKPRIIIYNVKEGIDAETLKETLITQNPDIKGEELEIKLNMNGRFGKHWVCSVDPHSFKIIMKHKKINLFWSRKNVREYIQVTQCQNCLGFGHSKKFCKEEQSCHKCGKTGHLQKECTKKERCKNCKNANQELGLKLDHKHNAKDNNCSKPKCWSLYSEVRECLYAVRNKE
ncbi:Hypothetical protein in type I retrotransposable element R1DM, partial [Stegodyphus mimosarum]